MSDRAAQIAERVSRMAATAARLVRAWMGVSPRDRATMESVVDGVIEDLLVNLKFRVKVDFDHEWSGKYWRGNYYNPPEYPEFEMKNESIDVTPAVHSIVIGVIRDRVVQELSRNGNLDGSPEALANSNEFIGIVKKVAESKNGAWGEADVELPTGRHPIMVEVQQKLRLVGHVLRIDLSVDDKDFGVVLDKITENADDWFPDTRGERDYEPD